MVPYNQKNPFSYVFKFHKADTFRKLTPFILIVCLYSWGVAWLEIEYWKLPETSHIRNISIMHTLLGFAISMLLVFRTNTAYDRWWEGRKLWGSLVNNSRNFSMKLSAILGDGNETQKIFFRKMITAYAYALHDHLHKENTRTALFEDEEHAHLFNDIDGGKHVPNQLAQNMIRQVQKMYNEKIITDTQQLYLNEELRSFTEICGACERIKNTPIPFSYSVFIKKFIFIYVITLPFAYVFSLGYFVIPVVGFIFYVLASLELIAEEIEDPFGGDPNDVPTDKLSENIGRNIAELL